MNIITEACRSH